MKKTKRYYKRFIIYILCTVILMNSIFINRKIESQAAATATVVGSAWLIEVLLGLGVTILGYDLVTRLNEPELDTIKAELQAEPVVNDWLDFNTDLIVEQNPTVTVDYTVLNKAAEIIESKKDTLVTVSNMYRETGLEVYNRDVSLVRPKTSISFNKFGDLNSNFIETMKTYLNIDYATLSNTYYCINIKQDSYAGKLFIPKGDLYVMWADGNVQLNNIAISKPELNEYYSIYLNKGKYDSIEYLKTVCDPVYFIRDSAMTQVFRYHPFTNNVTMRAISYDSLTIYGNAENYYNGDLVFLNPIYLTYPDQTIYGFWNRSLNISALKPIDTGLEITGDIAIPLDPAKYRGIISDQSVAGVRQALYEYGVLDEYVKEITGALDKQTATNQTWFSKIFDKFWEYFEKVINAITSVPVGIINTLTLGFSTIIDSSEGLIDSLLEKLLGALDAIKEGILSIPDILDDVLVGVLAIPGQLVDSFVDALPAVITSGVSIALEDDLPSNPDDPDDDSDEPTRSKNFFENLLYLFIYIAMILIKLLQIFIQLYIFIFSIFNIPASTSLLPSDLILGLEYMRSFPLPLFNLTLYQFMTGVLNIILLFSIVALLRRYVFRLRLPKVK